MHEIVLDGTLDGSVTSPFLPPSCGYWLVISITTFAGHSRASARSLEIILDQLKICEVKSRSHWELVSYWLLKDVIVSLSISRTCIGQSIQKPFHLSTISTTNMRLIPNGRSSPHGFCSFRNKMFCPGFVIVWQGFISWLIWKVCREHSRSASQPIEITSHHTFDG
jgi:hypothetical protein